MIAQRYPGVFAGLESLRPFAFGDNRDSVGKHWAGFAQRKLPWQTPGVLAGRDKQ